MSLVCDQDLPDELKGEYSHGNEGWKMEMRNLRIINPYFYVILKQILVSYTVCLNELKQLFLFRKNIGWRVTINNSIGPWHEIGD